MTVLVSLSPCGSETKARRYEQKVPRGRTLITHEGYYTPATVTPFAVNGYREHPPAFDRRGYWDSDERSWDQDAA